MAVSVAEQRGRLAFAGALVALALARVVFELQVPGAGFLESTFTLLAGIAAIGALASWGTEGDLSANPEGTALRTRGADLLGLTSLAISLVAEALTSGPASAPVSLGIAYAGFVTGATARVTLGAAVASANVAGAGLALLAVAAAAAFVGGRVDGLPTTLVVGGAGLLFLYGVLDRGAVGETVQSRSFQYGSGAVLLSVLALALGIGCYALAVRYDHTWDLTRNQRFTLSDHAAQVATGLTYDVKVTAFFRPSTPGRADVADMLDKFLTVTPRMTVEWVDPLQEPLRAKEAGISGDQGTLILNAEGRTRRLDGEVREDEMVQALVLLGSEQDHTVCWTMGHGEPDPDDEYTAEGLGVARLHLEGLNYRVQKTLVANVGVPRTCELVIVARPATEWLPYEIEALVAYLAEGGRVLLLLDAGDVPELARALARLGVSVGFDVVLDLNPNNQLFGVNDPSVVVLSRENYGSHPITRNLSAAVILPISRSLEALPGVTGLEVVELLHTSPEAWGETDIRTAPPTPNPATERIGEVPVMAVVTIEDPAVLNVVRDGGDVKPAGGAALKENVGRAVPKDFAPKPGGRLVVIGDSDFPSNQYVDLGNNRDLFLNAIAWLADEEDQIGERPATSEKLTLSAVGQALWFLLSVVVVPGAAGLAAVGTIVYRRYYL